MRYIEKIEISKFRSFGETIKIDTFDFNVFSGGNDSGKSNILKALNLFFNNQTDHHINKAYPNICNQNSYASMKIRLAMAFSVANKYCISSFCGCSN